MSNYIGYKQEDNARRKANNTGEEITSIGQNKNVKTISTKQAQLSTKQQVQAEMKKLSRLNKKQPVRTIKDMSQEEILELKRKYGIAS